MPPTHHTPKPTPTPLPFPLRFYSPTSPAPDPHGRTLSTILRWPSSRLESSHDYIQNLFPLPERSPFNPSAPLIDEYTFYTFRSSEELQSQLRRSLICMARFYGFDYVVPRGGDDGLPEAQISFLPLQHRPDFEAATANWLTSHFNHNHLRITRIIRSCRLLGLEAEALAFYDAVAKAAAHPSFKKSRMYWSRAAERSLYLAPEDEVDEGRGQGFLYRFEEERLQQQKNIKSEGEDPSEKA
ncbi:MAG: hypothetical protein LQ350_003347 [Teloschistes chrysophthalmus]|nr:MAG: hypothetical protein LQ350_003347 [Niorma chrysophthalma]